MTVLSVVGRGLSAASLLLLLTAGYVFLPAFGILAPGARFLGAYLGGLLWGAFLSGLLALALARRAGDAAGRRFAKGALLAFALAFLLGLAALIWMLASLGPI